MARRRLWPRRARSGGRLVLRRVWILATIGLVCAALWWAGQKGATPFAGGGLMGPPARVCRLDKVLDGDSLMLNCEGQSVEVRLHCIDAPEREQVPYAKQSRRHLREIAPRELEMREIELDRFGRSVAEVYSLGPERLMLNLEQVAKGQAAVYARYCDDPRFFRAEEEAREAGIGIWSRPGEQQTPWVFRHRGHRRGPEALTRRGE